MRVIKIFTSMALGLIIMPAFAATALPPASDNKTPTVNDHCSGPDCNENQQRDDDYYQNNGYGNVNGNETHDEDEFERESAAMMRGGGGAHGGGGRR